MQFELWITQLRLARLTVAWHALQSQADRDAAHLTAQAAKLAAARRALAVVVAAQSNLSPR